MAVARTRTRSYGLFEGRSRYGSGSTWSSRSLVLNQETCDDWVGNRNGNNPFTLDYYRTLEVANASSSGNYLGGSGSTMETYPLVTKGVQNHLSLATSASLAALAAQTAARSNPSRPHVLLPVSIFELQDIPKIFRKFGDELLSSIGDLNLRWQFGVAPIISDARRLANFMAIVERRTRELTSLNRKGGLRRRVTLSHEVASSNGSQTTLTSTPYGIYGRTVKVTERMQWGVARWRPSDYFMSMDSGEQGAYMRRTLLGLTASQLLQNAWEALPWSWLLDWFANLGDLLQAYNNSIAHLYGQCCVMTHTRTTQTTRVYALPSSDEAKITFHSRRNVVEFGRKLRQMAEPNFSASVPFLSGRQLSILGSLASQRMRGKWF